MRKEQSHTSNKVLILPALMLLATIIGALVILNNAGLILFNMFFGRPIYAVEMTYALNPYYDSGQMLVRPTFTFQLIEPKEPIETILAQTSIQVVGQETQFDVASSTFQFIIPVHVYTGQPQSQILLYDGTFTYNDNLLRQITVYLAKFDPSQVNEQEVFVDISGSYVLNGQTYTYTAGAALKIDV